LSAPSAMGIPKFYRWVSERYPMINQVVKGSVRPEFDNLYLDMNGIIHNCAYPREGDGAVKKRLSEEEQYAAIFSYIDRIFHLISPQKLLFMAVDGVAPRAKMNQQRQRRFKSAKDAKEALTNARAKGEEIKDDDVFDSNCITPGTSFMARLCQHLRYFVRYKMQHDHKWRKVKVILSGPDIPGEGEHKIMMYIRRAKMMEGYANNLRHCMYGLDADLIMLALVTHEPHFALLREEVVFGEPRKTGYSRKSIGKMGEFQLLHISVLREYIALEFNSECTDTKKMKTAGNTSTQSPYDLERIIDDWVYMCMMVGNDFIPNLPMLDIAEDGLDRMVHAYKTKVLAVHGHLVLDGRIQHKPNQAFLEALHEITSDLWLERIRNNFGSKQRNSRRYNSRPNNDKGLTPEQMQEWKEESKMIDKQQGSDGKRQTIDKDNLTYYKLKFRGFFLDNDDDHPAAAAAADGNDGHDGNRGVRSDLVKSRASSYKDIRGLCYHYLEGLTWVMRYYYEGCQSWGWFYPHHYAPMPKEMSALLTADDYLQVGLDMDPGQPYRPLEQLLSVLPPHSKALLPTPLHRLYSESSPIKHYYPTDFGLDSNFKSTPWESIALIPFIDEKVLKKAISDAKVFDNLTKPEQHRNRRYGANYIYHYSPSLDPSHPQYDELKKKDDDDVDGKHDNGSGGVVVKATLKGLPDITHPVSVERVWDYPPNDTRFVGRPVAGSPLCVAGFPYLRVIKNIKISLTHARVNVFGRDSKKPSLVIALPGLNKKLTHRRLAEFFLGPRTCVVNWPYLVEARVVRVMDQYTIWTREKQRQQQYEEDDEEELQDQKRNKRKKRINVISTPKTSKQSSLFVRKMYEMKHDWLSKKAVDIDGSFVPKSSSSSSSSSSTSDMLLFEVQVFHKMQRQPDTGRILKTFKRETVVVPAVSVMTKMPVIDSRFIEQDRPDFYQEFPKGQDIVYLRNSIKTKSKKSKISTTEQIYGAYGKVVSHVVRDMQQQEQHEEKKKEKPPKGKKRGLRLKLRPIRKPTINIRKIILSSEPRYFPAHKVASSLNISTYVLSMVTSSVIVKPMFTDLGLNLKSSKYKKMVPGYTRLSPQGRWEYSLFAIQVVFAYRKKFPLLFLGLHKKRSSGAFLEAKDLVKKKDVEGYQIAGGQPQELLDQQVKAMASWLKTQKCHSLLAYPASTKALAKNTLHTLTNLFNQQQKQNKKQQQQEEETEGFGSGSSSSSSFDCVVDESWRDALYRATPKTPYTPTGTHFALGDRVLFLRNDQGVSVGSTGVVVGIHRIELQQQQGNSNHSDTKSKQTSGGSGLNIDVLMERKQISGTNLHGNCPNGYGKTVAHWCLLNLDRTPKVLKQEQGRRRTATATATATATGGEFESERGGTGGGGSGLASRSTWGGAGGAGGEKASSNSKLIMPSSTQDNQTQRVIGHAEKVPRCALCTKPLGKNKTWQDAAEKNPYCYKCQQKQKQHSTKPTTGKSELRPQEQSKINTKYAAAAALLEEKKRKKKLMEDASTATKKETPPPAAAAASANAVAISSTVKDLFKNAKEEQQKKKNNAAAAGQPPQASPLAQAAAGGAPGLKKGTRVVLVGLKGKQNRYNGRVGWIFDFKMMLNKRTNKQQGRYVVNLIDENNNDAGPNQQPPQLVALKPQHVMPIDRNPTHNVNPVIARRPPHPSQSHSHAPALYHHHPQQQPMNPVVHNVVPGAAQSRLPPPHHVPPHHHHAPPHHAPHHVPPQPQPYPPHPHPQHQSTPPHPLFMAMQQQQRQPQQQNQKKKQHPPNPQPHNLKYASYARYSGSGMQTSFASGSSAYYSDAQSAPDRDEHKEFMSLLDALENAPDEPPPEDEDAEKDAEREVDIEDMRTRIDAIKARRSQVAGDDR